MRHALALVALLVATPVLAGGAPPPAAPPPASPPGARPGDKAGDRGGKHDEKREELRARVQQKVKTYLTVELSSRLGLDSARSVKLADAIAAQMQRKRAQRESMRADMQKLKEMVDQKTPDAQLKAQLETVVKQREKGEDVQAFLKDTSSFLSVQEQAKLAIAMPEVLRGLKGMMRDAKHGMRGGEGGGGGRRGERRRGDDGGEGF